VAAVTACPSSHCKRLNSPRNSATRQRAPGRALGHKGLRELGTIVTPDALAREHRELVVRKWTFVKSRRPDQRHQNDFLPLRQAPQPGQQVAK